MSRSPKYLPLTIWIVDNSSSMSVPDGNRMVETATQNDVRVVPCTRWDELKETVKYHARMSALLEAPTKFILLNNPADGQYNCPQEMSIAERGPDWVQDDLDNFMTSFENVRPYGVTPLSRHLRRVYQSIKHLSEKVVLVVATDGKPTDASGFMTPAVDREFQQALRQLQSKAWVVLRLCTDDNSVIEYYNTLDEQMELSIEVLDDYLDEAKEVYQHNPWLTYSLCLHRCREMGLSCHAFHRWLDWLDERTLTRAEIFEALQILGILESSNFPGTFLADPKEWNEVCNLVARQQKSLSLQKSEWTGENLLAFTPWNPIRKRTTWWIDIRRLKRHGGKAWLSIHGILPIMLVIVALVVRLVWII